MIKTETEKSAQESKTTLDKIIKICQLFDFPTAVFDSDFKCVYSKDNLIELNSEIDSSISDNIKNGNDFITTVFVIKDVQYCGRVLGIDGYYICELFNIQELCKIAKYTGALNKIEQNLESIKYNLSQLWNFRGSLNKTENDVLAFNMKSSLMHVDCLINDLIELIKIYTKNPNIVRFDFYRMLNSMIKRCNKYLEKCGRFIKLECECHEPLYIGADVNHATTAFINALQNSLLYSTKECVPVVTLSKIKEGNYHYAVVKIVNNIAHYEPYKNNSPILTFSNDKIGCGIPIMKRFAEESKIKLDLIEKNDNYYTIMKIPLVGSYEKDAFIFESDEFVFYETGIPDYLELKINEVAEIFSEDNVFV